MKSTKLVTMNLSIVAETLNAIIPIITNRLTFDLKKFLKGFQNPQSETPASKAYAPRTKRKIPMYCLMDGTSPRMKYAIINKNRGLIFVNGPTIDISPCLNPLFKNNAPILITMAVMNDRKTAIQPIFRFMKGIRNNARIIIIGPREAMNSVACSCIRIFLFTMAISPQQAADINANITQPNHFTS